MNDCGAGRGVVEFNRWEKIDAGDESATVRPPTLADVEAALAELVELAGLVSSAGQTILQELGAPQGELIDKTATKPVEDTAASYLPRRLLDLIAIVRSRLTYAQAELELTKEVIR